MELLLDIPSVLIFLGVVQSCFLGVFFAAGGGRAVISNRYLGCFLLVLGAIVFEMWLGYSGAITRVPQLVDFSEPLNFLLGPLLYLAVRARTRNGERFRGRQLLHLLPAALYALYHIPYMLQSVAFKLSVWAEVWRNEPAGATAPAPTMELDFLGLREIVTELTVAHVTVYTALAFWLLVRAYDAQSMTWWRARGGELDWMRTFVLQFSLTGIVVVAVKLAFPHDLGDHYIALFMTVIIYSTSASVLRRSTLLSMAPKRTGKKYEKSALTSERAQAVLEQLESVMRDERPYLRPSISLASLASDLGVTEHHLSQVLNEVVGLSFRDYLAQHRIEEAKRILADEANDNLRIEDLAQQVGYYSKSSFNAAFRRLTGVTPSKFRESARSPS